ncbi:BNR-4 repeat-containing protein [Isoptericola sp. 4D.3]|uniref:BNR-4 repeat-containing protein n=1 Tax=Isoptericola peretonis TaxID=2918523 RepID=A0ABT0J4W7_9MICO|nr:BNR-4 repeat-containing protein [Isoptericola sp. 4D.3]
MRRRPTRTLQAAAAALAAAAAVGVTAPPAAAAAVPTAHAKHSAHVDELPFTVDSSNQAGWWKPIDVVGGTTYVAYNAPGRTAATHEIHVAARGADGAWTDGCLRASDGVCATFVDDNGHNQPSIVVDGAGHVHAFVSMHHEQWNYFRTTTPGDVTSLVDVSSEMPDQDLAITYPVTARGADGDVYVMARAGADQRQARTGNLYRFDTGTGSWARAAVVADARDHSFYPDDLKVGSDGRVHLLWEWGPWPADPSRHLGSYAVYDPADGSFHDVAGNTLATPVTPSTPGAVVYQPYVDGEDIGSYWPALQTAKLSVHGDQLDGIAYRFRTEGVTAFDGYDVRFARWNGTAWQRETVLDLDALGPGVETSAAIETTSAGATTRVYAVVETTSCVTGQQSAVLRAEQVRGESTWRFGTLGDARTGAQRLSAVTATPGTDQLYVTVPSAGELFHATVPRTGGTPQGSSAAEVVAGLRGEASDVNVARGADVTVSSTLRADTGGALAVDGSCVDASRWISAADDARPVLTADWGTAQAVETVRVRSGYSKATGTADVLRSFSVELHSAAGWVPAGQVTNNTSATVTLPVPITTADQVRLVVTDPSSSATDVARVYEVEVLAADG